MMTRFGTSPEVRCHTDGRSGSGHAPTNACYPLWIRSPLLALVSARGRIVMGIQPVHGVLELFCREMPMLIEPSAMVIESIGTQQVLRLLLAGAWPPHNMGTKLRAFVQPDQEVVHMDIIIEHGDAFYSGSPTRPQRLERLQDGAARLRRSPWVPPLFLGRRMWTSAP